MQYSKSIVLQHTFDRITVSGDWDMVQNVSFHDRMHTDTSILLSVSIPNMQHDKRDIHPSFLVCYMNKSNIYTQVSTRTDIYLCICLLCILMTQFEIYSYDVPPILIQINFVRLDDPYYCSYVVFHAVGVLDFHSRLLRIVYSSRTS
jgi:hypothetical protein